MKKEDLIGIGIFVLIVIWWIVINTTASANENNDTISNCIKTTDNLAAASSCYSAWKIDREQIERQERKEFLKLNPWYRGNNWKWKDIIGYRCETIYSTQLLNNVTVCHKPILLN